MTTKIKIISNRNNKEMEGEMNDFIKDKEVIDIKLSEGWDSEMCSGGCTALIIYKEKLSQKEKKK